MSSDDITRSGGVDVSGEETRTDGGDITGRDKFDRSITVEGDSDRSREHIVSILNREIEHKNREIERLRLLVEELSNHVKSTEAAYSTVKFLVLQSSGYTVTINEYLMSSCIFLRECGLCEKYVEFHQGFGNKSRVDP